MDFRTLKVPEMEESLKLFASAALFGHDVNLPHPLSILDKGQLYDLSSASLLLEEVDGDRLKEISFGAYESLLEFAFRCSRNSILEMFSHPASNPCSYNICSFEGKDAESCFHSYIYANIAIAKYNHLNKDAKLRLANLIKVNTKWCLSEYYYITFSAISEHTGKLGVYQAALKFCRWAGLVLGLFRDYSAHKTLAIISIPGAEEYLSARKKVVEDANAPFWKEIFKMIGKKKSSAGSSSYISVFLEELTNEQLCGNQVDGRFPTAYDYLIKACTEKLDQPSTKDHLKNYFKTIKNNFGKVGFNPSGWVQNEETTKFENEDEVWKSLIEQIPEAEKWKMTPFCHSDYLYSKDRAVESIATSKESISKPRSDSVVSSAIKGKKRKAEDMFQGEFLTTKEELDNVVPALREGNAIVDKVRPQMYPSELRLIEFVSATLS